MSYNTNLQNKNNSLRTILNTINSLPEASNGVELPELTNEGTSVDLLKNKQLIDGEGNVVTGSIETKTSSDLTVSGATVTVPSGYYADNASKSVATATQATPSVSVSTSGLITASSTQSAGYVTAGTKSATKQLTTQAAKTVTPGTANKTAVAKNVYTTGAVTVRGDANLVAENIVKGKTIFDVTGTAETGATLPTLSSPASESEVFINKEYIDQTGVKKTGTFTIDNEITSQNNLITQIRSSLNGKAGGSSGSVEGVGTCSCNIVINDSDEYEYWISYSILQDGVITAQYYYDDQSNNIFIENLVCNSVITIVHEGALANASTEGCTEIYWGTVFSEESGVGGLAYGTGTIFFFSAPSLPNTLAEIQISFWE